MSEQDNQSSDLEAAKSNTGPKGRRIMNFDQFEKWLKDQKTNRLIQGKDPADSARMGDEARALEEVRRLREQLKNPPTDRSDELPNAVLVKTWGNEKTANNVNFGIHKPIEPISAGGELFTNQFTPLSFLKLGAGKAIDYFPPDNRLILQLPDDCLKNDGADMVCIVSGGISIVMPELDKILSRPANQASILQPMRANDPKVSGDIPDDFEKWLASENLPYKGAIKEGWDQFKRAHPVKGDSFPTATVVTSEERGASQVHFGVYTKKAEQTSWRDPSKLERLIVEESFDLKTGERLFHAEGPNAEFPMKDSALPQESAARLAKIRSFPSTIHAAPIESIVMNRKVLTSMNGEITEKRVVEPPMKAEDFRKINKLDKIRDNSTHVAKRSGVNSATDSDFVIYSQVATPGRNTWEHATIEIITAKLTVESGKTVVKPTQIYFGGEQGGMDVELPKAKAAYPLEKDGTLSKEALRALVSDVDAQVGTNRPKRITMTPQADSALYAFDPKFPGRVGGDPKADELLAQAASVTTGGSGAILPGQLTRSKDTGTPG